MSAQMSVPTSVAAIDRRFDNQTLHSARHAVAALVTAWGATTDQIDALILITGELAANAVRHGGGHGRLRLWRLPAQVRLAVSDRGPGLPDPTRAGLQLPPPGALGGRGLWLVRAFADAVEIYSGGEGATIIVRLAYGPPPVMLRALPAWAFAFATAG